MDRSPVTSCWRRHRRRRRWRSRWKVLSGSEWPLVLGQPGLSLCSSRLRVLVAHPVRISSKGFLIYWYLTRNKGYYSTSSYLSQETNLVRLTCLETCLVHVLSCSGPDLSLRSWQMSWNLASPAELLTSSHFTCAFSSAETAFCSIQPLVLTSLQHVM